MEQVDKFKKMYSSIGNFRRGSSLEETSQFFYYMLQDMKYLACYTETDDPDVVTYRITENNNKFVLPVYSCMEEIPSDILEASNVCESTFLSVWEILNELALDAIVINPQSDMVEFSKSELTDLYRQKRFKENRYPIIFHEEKDFLKQVYKLDEITEDIENRLDKNKYNYFSDYDNQTQEGQNEILQMFYDDLLSSSVFMNNVNPLEGQTDVNGNLVTNKFGAYYFIHDDGRTLYHCFVDKNDMKAFHKENIDVALCTFEDYIDMIDSAKEPINGVIIHINGGRFEVPLDFMFELKVNKDIQMETNNSKYLCGLYSMTDEMKNIEKQIKDYFSSFDEVEKIWLEKYVALYENGESNQFAIWLNLRTAEDKYNICIDTDEISRILNYKCFAIYIPDEEKEDPACKLIYEKNK